MIATADPGCGVGACQQCVDFGHGQEAHQGAFPAFGLDGEDALYERGVLGVAVGGEVEQRPYGSEACVPAGGDDATFVLEVVEEGGDHRSVEVIDAEVRWCLPGLFVREAEQQPEAVPVGGNGVGASVLLGHHPLCEERFEGWGEHAHLLTSKASSRRRLVSAMSSGAAERYQYVDFGSVWPMKVESNGNSVRASPPVA